MNSLRSTLFGRLGLAMVVGLLTFLAALTSLSRRERALREAYRFVPAIRASRDLEAGETLNLEDLESIQVPLTFGPMDRFEHPEDLDQRILAVPVTRGSYLSESLLVPQAANRLAQRLPEGTRGVVLRIDGPAGERGEITAGDQVDLYGTFPLEEQQGGTCTIPLGGPLRVMGFGPSEGARPRPVCIAAPPDLVPRLLDAQASGRMVLTVRPEHEMEPQSTAACSTRDLTGRYRPRAATRSWRELRGGS